MAVEAEKTVKFDNSTNAPTTTELRDYKESIQTLYDLNASNIIANGKTEHAAAILELFF